MATGLNTLLLVEVIAVVIVASAFLFYWNRLIASVAAFIVRLITWRSFSAYISIGSLQISPLAGRISFRDIEYHSSNLSFRASHGNVTWRYWLLRIKQETDSQSTNTKRNRLPCRISVYAEGVEGFVYNRTPAYDAIVERMKKHDQQATDQSQESLKTTGNGDGGVSLDGGEDGTHRFGARLRRAAKSATTSRGSGGRPSSDESTHKPTDEPLAASLQPKPVKAPYIPGVNWFRETLPIELRIVTGSMILGSDATPMVLIGDFTRAEGTLGITDSRSSCDEYKLSLDLHFQEPKILMRTNVDYSGPLLAHGKKAYDELYKQEPDIAKQPPSKLSAFLGFHLLSKRFPFLHDPKFSTPTNLNLPYDRVWKGLARYRVTDENVPKAPRREEREYAKVTTLVDAPALDLTYYADTPGIVPSPSEAETFDEGDEFGNVELPPEYGIDIVVYGGIIKYGPWADRQRDALQRAFAPSIFFDSEPKARLQPGDTRIHTTLILNLQLSEETTLRIPTREPSKDWIYDNSNSDADRKYGWLDVTVGPNSAITYTQSQFATKRGYDSMLVLHLDSLGIASSVNLDTFIQSKSCKLSMTMPTPLRWDDRRDWGLDITLDSPDITVLRDHVQLISDLARDWSSGAVGDFHHFVPNHYNFRVTLLNYAFHLFINDFNIVDQPRSRDSNAFMDVYGPQMSAYVAVAATQYRPDMSTVPFTVNLTDARVELSVPSWDTHRSFCADETVEVGKIGLVTASGSYTYYSVPRPEHQETLVLHLEGRRVAYKALGWALRRMFSVKDNYFGAFTQFTTMQEYLERFDHDPNSMGDPVEEKYRPGRSDAFGVQITMNVEESLILMSDEIYDFEKGMAMPVPQLQMALKSVEHFMELSLDATPTYVVATDNMEETYRLGIAPPIRSKEAIFMEGLQVKANRLFGPQPRATTYLCLWEVTAPRVTGFLSPEFVGRFQGTIDAVVYNFKDIDNAPAKIYIPETPPDVTFFKLGIDQVSLTLFTDSAAVAVDLPAGVNLDTSTWATRSFKSAVGLIIPYIRLTLLEHDTYQRKWVSSGQIQTAVNLDVYNAPSGWQEKASEQQAFLLAQDGHTQRIWYMYRDGKDKTDGHHINGVYLPRPRSESLAHSDDVTSILSEGNSTDASDNVSFALHSSDTEIDVDLTRNVSHSRRSRSFATARETAGQSSVGDESDSVSDASSSFGSTSATSVKVDCDMASALAERLGHFRSIHNQSLPVFPEWAKDDDSDPGLQFPGLSSAHEGKIVRMVVGSVEMDISPKTMTCVSDMGQAVSQISPTAERRLDGLLVAQTDAVLENVTTKPSLMIDISAPSIRVRLNTHIDGGENNVDAHLQDLSSCVVFTPLIDGSKSKSNVAIAFHSVEVTASTDKLPRGELSLADIADAGISPTLLLPMASVKMENLQVGLHKDNGHTQVRGRAGFINVPVVTGAVACLRNIVNVWESAAKDLPKTPSPSLATAQLLYRIIHNANVSDAMFMQPMLVYEEAYGLHVEDQRNIRRDVGWVILSRLRCWLRSVGNGPTDQDEPSPEEAAHFVVSQLAHHEEGFCGNELLVTQQPFVKRAFGPSVKTSHPSDELPNPKSFSAFIDVKELALRHWGRLLGSSTIAPSLLQLKSASAGLHKSTSLQDQQSTQKVRILTAIRDFNGDLHDSILSAIEILLKTVKSNDEVSPIQPIREIETDHPIMISIVNCHLHDGQFSLLAAGLRLRVAVNKVQLSTGERQIRQNVNAGTRTSVRRSVSGSTDSVDVSLLQLPDGDEVTTGSADRTVVAIKLEDISSVTFCHSHFQEIKPPSFKTMLGIKKIHIDSRPQLRALLSFATEWKGTHLKHYKPFVEQINVLILRKPRKIQSMNKRSPDFSLDLSIGAIHLSIRAAKAVWIRWDFGKIFITRHGRKSDVEFGVRAEPQTVGAYSSVKKTKSRDSASIRLPSITALGSTRDVDGRPYVSANISLGFFVGVLKPAILDRLLSLHQRLGHDIMHLVDEYRDMVQKDLASRHEKSTSTSSSSQHDGSTSDSAPTRKMLMDIRLSVSGIRFGLRADDVATTLLFEALSLRGHATNMSTEDAAMLWRAKVDHFGLSLGHLGTTTISDDAEPIRNHRSASMVFDVDVQEIPSHKGISSQLNIYLSRAHTVMHVAALNELSDLVKSWQYDIHVLRDNRATEVAEVKSATSKLLKKLEAGDKPVRPEASWFASRLLTVELTGFGIAVPLDEAAAINLQRGDHSAGPALLFSIRVMSFQNRRNETARFKMQQMALQFLDKFDQGIPEHFTGDYHPFINRMRLPSLDSQAQMSSTADAWTLNAHCSADDFKLSLAPDIVDGVFKLLDLYEQGRIQLADLERNYRNEAFTQNALDAVAIKYDGKKTSSPSSTRYAQRISIRMSYTFNSGIVELHRTPSPGDALSLVETDARGRPGRAAWHDTFTLPAISVWVDYAGPRSDMDEDDDRENPGVVIFNAAVHESRNVLRPSILPFFVELANRVQKRNERTNRARPSPATATARKSEMTATVSETTMQVITPTSETDIRLRFTLRIDQSELRLSCAPDSNAYVDLKWESGGFMASTSLGKTRMTTVAGSISGVKSSLSHEFAERGRSCTEAGAKDMAFSVTICPSEDEQNQKGLSVVVDTHLAGQFRLDAFSAWLIFTSVWIDNAPKLDVPLRTGIPEVAAPTATPDPTRKSVAAPERQKMAVAALIRFRAIDFDADIAVSKTKLEITPIELRTISNGEKTEVDLRIGITQVTARGDISGDLRSERLVFNTMRRSSRASNSSEATVLSMSIDAGDLSGNLFLADTNILRFRLEPAVVTLADDWKAFASDPSAQVFLAFAVKAGQFTGVLRLLAIPRLLGNMYSILDMVGSQQRIAAQRSEIFKAHATKKSIEPSPVAAVILQTARLASATSTASHIKTAQTMRFDLVGIDIGVFNEDYQAGGQVTDFYRFVVGKVEADLKRHLSKEDLPVRDLGLLISLVRWDNCPGDKTAAREKAGMTAKELIDVAWRQGHDNVIVLPSMTLSMNSNEYPNPQVLDFDFDLVWGETDGDVGILPNFFEQAILAFQKLLKGLDEQELSRARPGASTTPRASANNKHKTLPEDGSEGKPAPLQYRPRNPRWSDTVPAPRLKMLGEGTGEAARLIPRIRSATKELPALSHRFVTLPLEEGMDLLLKLYEKQLPERDAT